MIHFLGTTATFNPTDPSTWIQGGVAVVVGMTILVLFIRGYIVPGSTYKKLEEKYEKLEVRNVALEAQNNHIHDRLEGEIFDTLKASVVALSNSNDLVRGALKGGGSGGRSDG